ncbi:MAG TPA: hypothetical protein PKK48_03720 [Phycisphaerae bacterium]|nr:hypothetical protein [Phycisphaerae bacterium]
MSCGVVRGDTETDRLGKTLVSQLKQYHQAAAGPFRKAAGIQAINTLLELAQLQAINDEPFLANDAISQATRIASADAPEMLPVIQQSQEQNGRLLEIGKHMRQLTATIKNAPHDSSARYELVMDVLILSLDRPQDAKKYLSADMDDAIISRVNLAAGNAEKYPPQVVLELADWYFTLTDKARGPQMANVLRRAKIYYELYRKKTDNDLDEKTIANIEKIDTLLRKNKIDVDLGPLADQADISDIRIAIDNAKNYLIAAQQPDGSFPTFATEFDVTTAQWPTPLVTLALLKCGVSSSDTVIRNALKFMRSYKSDNRMYNALLCSLLSMPQVRDAKAVATLAEQLQLYSGTDLPITRHYVTTALNDATSAGAIVKRIYWIKTLNFYRLSQNPDGGWGFSENRPTNYIPTLIALNDMIISLKQLGKDDATIREHPNVKKGMEWIGKNFENDVTADIIQYYLLLTQLASLRGTAIIDNRDSMQFVKDEIFRIQDKNGSWQVEGSSPYVSTAMALLCLTAK